jgi:hypothetical protein
MAEPVTVHDLELHFTHGDPVACTVTEGKGSITSLHPCTHCGASATLEVTLENEDGSHTSLIVYRDKLNAMQKTTRTVQPPTLDELIERREASTQP